MRLGFKNATVVTDVGAEVTSLVGVMRDHPHHTIILNSRLLAILRWAALSAVVGVGLVTAYSQWFLARDLSTSDGVIATLVAAVAGALGSVLYMYKT